MNYRDYFAQIMELATLSDKDRESLKLNRGFTDDVIDKLQFKSCGPELVKKLPADFPSEILNSLQKENILIPYLGSKGEVLHLRPHKYGFKEAGIQVYIPFPLLEGSRTGKLVLAESEFKAVASCMMGIPAIGIPGIASFSKSKLGQLTEVLHSLECKELIVCFDNEVKSDPNFENFKQDWTKRYDTFIYEYIMAAVIQKEGIPTRIARLKDEWRVNGKADIDGILARRVDPAVYRFCINSAKDSLSYRKSWKFTPVHQQYIDRKIDRYFYPGKIAVSFGCYVHKKGKSDIKLTNFTAEILHTMKSVTGYERLIRIVDQYGHSAVKVFTPDLMVSRAAFQKFLYECGDFQFYGKDETLNEFWEYVILHQDGRYISRLKHYGYDEESGVWFFGNGAYHDGQYYKISDDGIYWVDELGFKLPEALNDFEVPLLSDENGGVDLASIHSHLGKMVGENEAKVILGWTIGNFFMPEIIKEFKNYPFLFFHGKFEEGKSTICNWMTSFFGYTKKGLPFAGSTTVGIRNVISQLSMIPTWLEEYRNQDQQLIGKNNLLRSVYDRSTIVKGTKIADQVKSNTLRSSLIISGEEHPTDAALISRCLLISLHTKKDVEHYQWMMSHQSIFNAIGHHLLTNINTYWPEVKSNIKEYMRTFEREGMDVTTRSKLMYSMVAGIWEAVMGQDDQFTEYIGNTTLLESKKVSHATGLHVFFEDIVDMRNTSKIPFDFVKRATLKIGTVSKDICYFWFAGAYSMWEFYLKKLRTEIPVSKNAVLDLLYREPYFMKKDVSMRINEKGCKGILLDINHPKFPPEFMELINRQDQNPMYRETIKEEDPHYGQLPFEG